MEYSYLLDNPYMRMQNSTFGGPKIQISNVNAQLENLIGAQGGWTTNDTFFIGGTIMSSTNINTPNIDYAGILLGYNFNAQSSFHPSISIMYGKGAVTKSVRKTLIISSRINSQDKVITAYNKQNSFGTQSYEAFFSDLAPFVVLETQASIQLNINKWLRLYSSIGYRHIVFNDPTQISYNSDDFSGITYNLGLDIGWWVNIQ
jgi:hypothetical protein